MNIRGSGVLAHITSLPSRFGVGDAGIWARRFVSLLHDLHQTYWQVLPLGPSSPAMGNSPYAGYSAFAANPLLICMEDLHASGMLPYHPDEGVTTRQPGRADYDGAGSRKMALLYEAFRHCREQLAQDAAYHRFIEDNRFWLEDWALFSTLKSRFHGQSWQNWPDEFRFRRQEALDAWSREGLEAIEFEYFKQYVFVQQWQCLRRACDEASIRLVGDLPIYVTFDSADVWAHPELFKLDDNRLSTVVAGVPPDYFSRTGQLWGNPVYDWDAHKNQEFSWWTARMKHTLGFFDHVRVDHFRGLSAYWEVPAGETTAQNGKWVEAPGQELFQTFARRIASLPVIAEDLGVIDADVRMLKKAFNLPGMKILQFAFGEEAAKHLPHLFDRNCVVYSGTHDNNTVRGWFEREASPDELRTFQQYVGRGINAQQAPREMIRLGMMSVADTAIFPLQDILGLDSAHRMNTPATLNGNWEWRMQETDLEAGRYDWFREMTKFYNRC